MNGYNKMDNTPNFQDLELVRTNEGTLVRSLSFNGQNFNFDLTGQMSDPVVDEEGRELIIKLAILKGLKLRVTNQ